MAHRDPQQGRARDRQRTCPRSPVRRRADCAGALHEVRQGARGAGPPPVRRMQRKHRAADRARYAEAKAKGAPYGGRDPEPKRRNARERSRRRHRDRIGSALCTRCGLCSISD